MSRWQKAQQAERHHSAHTSVISDQETAKSRFNSNWGENISALSNKEVLAVGGGTGIIHAVEQPKVQISIDPLYEKIRIPRTQTNAEIICGSGECLPFPNESFDVVYSHNVLDHTLNPSHVLDEISRILRPDGQFFFSVNIFSLPKFIRNELNVVDKPHPHHFSENEIKDILYTSGFDVKNINKNKYWFGDESITSLIAQKEIKKLGGKLAQIELFCAVCHLR